MLLLKDTNVETSLSLLREQQLIISLNSHLLPALQTGELGPSDFAPLHAAVLTLAAKCLCPKPRLTIRPVDDAELRTQGVELEYDGRRITRFEVLSETAFEALKTSIGDYLAFASNTTGSEFRCVLSPQSASTNEKHPNALALQPTIGDIIIALNRNLDILSDILRQIDNFTHKLASQESISSEDVLKITQSAESGLGSKLTAGQLRSLAISEMNRLQQETTNRALRYMHSIEVLVLLIWRHITYFQSGRYLEDHFRSSRGVLAKSRSGGFQSLSASLSSKNINSFTIQGLLPVLDNLESMVMPIEIFGRDTNSRESFLHVVCRKLKETIKMGQEIDGHLIENDV